MSYSGLLEDLIRDIGGCGRFQYALTALVQLSKTIATWTMIHMTFNGQEPSFTCINNLQTRNGTDIDFLYNVSDRSCTATNLSDCSRFQYDGSLHTIVSEVSSQIKHIIA